MCRVSAETGSALLSPCHSEPSRAASPGLWCVRRRDTCCTNRAQRREYKQKSLQFGIFVGSPQATHSAARRMGAQRPARMREMHFFCLYFYKAKHSYSFPSGKRINRGCLPFVSVLKEGKHNSCQVKGRVLPGIGQH